MLTYFILVIEKCNNISAPPRDLKRAQRYENNIENG
jgi:hypothetical protein